MATESWLAGPEVLAGVVVIAPDESVTPECQATLDYGADNHRAVLVCHLDRGHLGPHNVAGAEWVAREFVPAGSGEPICEQCDPEGCIVVERNGGTPCACRFDEDDKLVGRGCFYHCPPAGSGESRVEYRVAGMLREFHDVFVPDGTDVRAVRRVLLAEEFRETDDALASGDRLAIAQELADLVYVAYGTALVYGIDLDAALAEVHRANMSKLGADGLPVLRDDGKVLKGPNYQSPDMRGSVGAAFVVRRASDLRPINDPDDLGTSGPWTTEGDKP